QVPAGLGLERRFDEDVPVRLDERRQVLHQPLVVQVAGAAAGPHADDVGKLPRGHVRRELLVERLEVEVLPLDLAVGLAPLKLVPDLFDSDRKSTRLNSSHVTISYAG